MEIGGAYRAFSAFADETGGFREAFGADIRIMADPSMGWNVGDAKRMLQLRMPFDMRWVEEPGISGGKPDDRLTGFRHVPTLNTPDDHFRLTR